MILSTSATTRAGAIVCRQTLGLSLRSSQPARSQGTQAGVPCSTRDRADALHQRMAT